MAQKQVSVRISAQGGDKLKADLVQIGQVGERSFGQLDRAASRSSGNMQNAAFQVQDFFVQVGAGTAPTQALAQQLPQLLGSMGLVGVLAGTAVAAIIPFASSMLGARDDADALEQSLRSLEDAVKTLEGANQRATTSFSELRKTYGANAEEARQLFEIQREIAELQAGRAFGAAARSVGQQFSFGMTAEEMERLAQVVKDVEAGYADLGRRYQEIEDKGSMAGQAEIQALNERRAQLDALSASAAEYIGILETIEETFGVTRDAAAELALASAQVQQADTSEERLEAARSLAEAIFEQTNGLRNASDESVALYSALLEAVSAGLDLEALDIAGNIGSAADEADRLAANLLRVEGIKREQSRNSAVVFDPRDPRYNATAARAAQIALEPDRQRTQDSLIRPDNGPRGGGGGQSAQNELMREAQRIFEQTRTDAERYATEQAKLNVLMRSGAIDADTYQRAIDMIGEKYKGAGDGAKFFEDITGDLKSAILDLGVNGAASFDQITDAIKRTMIQALLFGEGPLAGLFGGGLLGFFGGGGSGTGTLGLPSFDGGGSTGWGARSGGLDGKGGFLAMMHPRETVTDHTKGSSGGGGGTVVQINNFSGQQVQEQRERGPNGEELIRVTVGKQIAGGDHDRAMRRFGARPAAVKR